MKNRKTNRKRITQSAVARVRNALIKKEAFEGFMLGAKPDPIGHHYHLARKLAFKEAKELVETLIE